MSVFEGKIRRICVFEMRNVLKKNECKVVICEHVIREHVIDWTAEKVQTWFLNSVSATV